MAVATVFMIVTSTIAVSGQNAPATPVPRPFPGAGTTTAAPRTQPEAAAPAPATAAPAPAPTPQPPPPSAPAVPPGVPVYPTAEYLDTFDAGSGQTYVLYGVNVPYADIVTYYRNTLKRGGDQVFRPPMPPTHQFELGRFQNDRMAFPPSVVVKDYTWNNSPGYLHVSGTTEKRYRTIIQIVAPSPAP